MGNISSPAPQVCRYPCAMNGVIRTSMCVNCLPQMLAHACSPCTCMQIFLRSAYDLFSTTSSREKITRRLDGYVIKRAVEALPTMPLEVETGQG